ncbi:MAG: hypothetical protein SFV22_01855 [Saprospiraceae bacterium]|nr:hypothetical protein [Saprospiraceae bacterium]
MQNSDLVELLNALTREERKRLITYLDEPGRVRKECADLTRYLSSCLDEDAMEKTRRELVYNIVFAGKPWVDNKLAKLMGETLAHIREFVAQQTMINQMNELHLLHYLQVFYHERGLEDKFWSAHRQIKLSEDNKQMQSGLDFYIRFLSENQAFYLQSAKNNLKDDINLSNTIKALDEYYLIERLWLTCQILNQNQLAPVEIDATLNWLSLEQHDDRLQWFTNKPLNQVLLATVLLLSGKNEDNYRAFREFVDLLHGQEKGIPLEYINLFELSACNFGIRLANSGKLEFLELVFEIQKRRVESNRVFLPTNQIMATEFLSIMMHALRLKAFDWAKNFIENQRTHIKGVMPSEQYYEFALANYYYHTGDYQQACHIMMTSEYDDIQCRFSSRIIEIKALAERVYRQQADHRVGEYLEDRIEAAILFFFRLKDVGPVKKKMGKRFSDTMKRILHAEAKRDVTRLKIIQKDIAEADFIAERQWISQLVEDLVARYKK